MNATVWNKATDRLLDAELNPHGLVLRRAAIFAPHVEALNHYVERIRVAHGNDPTVPWFDPAGGGNGARVLLLAQDPSEVAAKGSGFISPDNNDPTACNTTLACRAANLESSMRVHWNIYPWWVAKKDVPGHESETFAEAMKKAIPFVDELVNQLLPELGAVVLLGGEAQKGWEKYVKLGGDPHHLTVFRCPHPSPLAYNKLDKATGRKNSALTIEALQLAREIAISGDAAVGARD